MVLNGVLTMELAVIHRVRIERLDFRHRCEGGQVGHVKYW